MKEESNNKFLFAVFEKQFSSSPARFLCFLYEIFSSSISIFVLIKLEHIFHGRDSGFSEWKKETQRAEYEILWEKLLYWRKEVGCRMCEFSLYWLVKANKKKTQIKFWVLFITE